MQKLGLSLTLTALLLSGCGESIGEISNKDKVIVLKEISRAGCLLLENAGDKQLQEYTQDYNIANISYTTKDNTVNCATFGKTPGELYGYNYIETECLEIPFEQIDETFPNQHLSRYQDQDKACVVAFNVGAQR